MNKYIFILLLATIPFFACNEEVKKTSTETTSESTETTSFSKGETIYKSTCQACHQSNGEGMEGVFPPLANSDYLLANSERAIEQIIKGSQGEITVNGKTYNGLMPPQILEDDQIADVLNYVLNSWGNKGGKITVEQVKAVRSKK